MDIMPKRSTFAMRAFKGRPARRRARRVSLQLQTATTGSTASDGLGHDQLVFSTKETPYGYVKQLRGQELVLARELVPLATHQVEIDYSTHCNARSRFKFPGSTTRFLNVESVDNFEERNCLMVCLCHEERV
jgi:head-tail adaptor